MAPPFKKAKWAFTLRSDEVDYSTVTTNRDGLEVEFKNGKYRIYVGTEEQADDKIPYPHRHCMLHCYNDAVTATRAKAAIAFWLEIPEFKPSYFKPVDNKYDYLNYMFKNDPDNQPLTKKRKLDNILEYAVVES